MTESVADKERRLAALAEKLLPEIVEGLRRGDAALEIARRLEKRGPDQGDADADLKTLYRWVMFVEERLEKKRRRVGILAAVLLWVGFFGLLAGVLGLVTTMPIPVPWGLGGLGLVIAGSGVALGFLGKRRIGVTAEEIIG
ncbi:MAG: hypothetical protein ACOCW6_11000 [Spirochaetota bacterium]